ncbi:MAG: hypothetical protein ACE5I1_11510 [bacterium]
MAGVPITLLVDGFGKVENVWLGLLTDERIAEVVAAVLTNKSFTKTVNRGKL